MTNYKKFCDIVRRRDFVVLDTETTLLSDAEICDIAIVDAHGNVLLDTLVKPIGKIPEDAMRIHGITNEMVENAPTWGGIAPQVHTLLYGRDVIIYNANYDRNVLISASRHAQVTEFNWRRCARYHCAMEVFAPIYGDWNSYHKSYRWQKLTTAASYYDIQVENAHRALGDCLMTLAVCNKMAEEAVSE